MRRVSGFAFVGACIVAMAPMALAASGARSAAASSSGTQPATACPKGQVWAATANRCVATTSINYNASKSNTGNVATTSPRYHCGKGEYMLANGDCVPNPPSNPN